MSSLHFISLISLGKLAPESRLAVSVDEKELLIINHQNNFYVIANECGHFGVPLENGTIDNGIIYCSRHRIGFDLSTGDITNRPWEGCEPVKTYQVEIRENQLGILVEE